MKSKIAVFALAILLLFGGCKQLAEPIVSETEQDDDNVKAEIHFIDVGQGSSTLVKIGDYVALIDAGPDSAERHIVNYLSEQDIDDIDLLVVTHPHDDHIGAVDFVLGKFEVKRIIDSDLYHPGWHYNDYQQAVDRAILDGADYSPDEDTIIQINKESYIQIIENGDDWQDVNNNSVVVKIKCGNTSFFISGDLEKQGEAALLTREVDLNADVFLAGHHGSSSANSKDFIEAIDPSYVVVSAGSDNQYGLPHQAVCEYLTQKQIEVLETAYYGDIVFKSDGSKVYKKDESQEVTIVEVDYKNEVVTIKNNSVRDIDLTGWYLISYSGDQRYNFPNGFTLKAGNEVRVTSGKNSKEDNENYLKWSDKNMWSNSNPDPAYLYSSDGKMISMKY